MDPPTCRIIFGTAWRSRPIWSAYSLKFLEMWPVLGSRTWMCRTVAPALKQSTAIWVCSSQVTGSRCSGVQSPGIHIGP